MKTIFAFGTLALAALGCTQVIWDNTSFTTSFTTRNQDDAPALHIINTSGSDIALGHVAFQGKASVQQELHFFIANSGGGLLDMVSQATGATAEHTLIGTDVNWVLLAGQAYYIGAIANVDGNHYDYGQTFPSQNGLHSTNNGNFSGYTNPSYYGDAGADMSWQLSSAVPEPATMVVLGLGAIGTIVRRRKKA